MLIKPRTTEYKKRHDWIRSKLGIPQECWKCFDNSNRVYEWANIYGEYKYDIEDWVRLCVPCHRAMDDLTRIENHCMNGHEFTPENTYMPPTVKERECRACRKMRHRKYHVNVVLKKKRENKQ